MSEIKFPVLNVKMVDIDKVVANDYNPNKVAPPEMELLKHSIEEDGYTQPIVTYYDKKNDKYIVIDGFHRYRCAKEYFKLKQIPIVTIDTNGLEIPGEARDGSTINSNIKIYDDETKNNYLSDAPKITTVATIRARGNSSLRFDKKGYLLKFINEDGSENKQEVMGMDSHDEWILNGPFLDKTLIRNYMCYNISVVWQLNVSNYQY